MTKHEGQRQLGPQSSKLLPGLVQEAFPGLSRSTGTKAGRRILIVRATEQYHGKKYQDLQTLRCLRPPFLESSTAPAQKCPFQFDLHRVPLSRFLVRARL
jgi:hypothetical protein